MWIFNRRFPISAMRKFRVNSLSSQRTPRIKYLTSSMTFSAFKIHLDLSSQTMTSSTTPANTAKTIAWQTTQKCRPLQEGSTLWLTLSRISRGSLCLPNKWACKKWNSKEMLIERQSVQSIQIIPLAWSSSLDPSPTFSSINHLRVKLDRRRES